MRNLVIAPTKSSPAVLFDADRGVLEIRGQSYPENAAKFYAPVFDCLSTWLELAEGRTTEVNLEIIYVNSSSSKALLNLFDMLDRAVRAGRDIAINWRYHEENETALECGEEFREELEAVPFNLIRIKDESPESLG